MTHMEFEKTALGHEEVEKLWKAFKLFDVDGNDAISAKELRQVMRSLGHNPTDTKLRVKEVDVDLAHPIDFDEFKALMLDKQVDSMCNLKLAFSVFDEDNSGQIAAMEMRSVMSKFGLTDEELDEIVKEVDEDGDGSIDFEEFCKLMPDELETKMGYKDSLPLPASSLKTTTTSCNGTTATNSVAPTTTKPTPQQAATDIASEVAKLRELLAQHPQSKKGRGTSRLQMQIGLFRLLQAAAYRTFRESFCANQQTHLRVKNLPYRITDFVEFVKKAIELYKGLGVVEEACYPVLDAVVESLEDEYAQLE